MAKSFMFGRLSRKALLAASSAAALCGTAAAQDAEPQENSDETIEANDDRIVVTGSRIQRTNATAAQPVTVLDADQIAFSGEVAVGELLNELPALRSTFSLSNSDRFIGTAGLNRLDLRGLGDSRTLVLVDGRRHVSATNGTQAVDTNSIPPALIERVEVLTGGASSIYGGDAVTGVVNFILKDDFDGLEVSAQWGETDRGDGQTASVSVTAGSDFDNGRGNAVISFGIDDIEPISNGARPWSSGRTGYTFNNLQEEGFTCAELGLGCDGFVPIPVTGNDIENEGFYGSDVFNMLLSNEGLFYPEGFSAFRFGTPVFGLGDGWALNADGTASPFQYGQLVDLNQQLDGSGLSNRFLNSLGFIRIPLERFNAFSAVRYDLTPNLRAYGEVKYTNIEALQTSQPSFDFVSDIFINADNAFLPEVIRDDMVSRGRSGAFYSRFHTDLGRRGETNERETVRFVLGLEGDLPGGLAWDASYVYGQTNVTLTAKNNRINGNFEAAIDAVVDPSDGLIKCRNQVASAQPAGYEDPAISDGCIPLNIFGTNQFDPAALDFVFADTVRRDKVRQEVLTAVLTGDSSAVFTLPAGPVGFAVGGEYREEYSETNPAALDALGLTFGNELQPSQGQFDVTELFGEVSVPLLDGVFLAEELTFDAAIRYADYSTVGETTAWNVAGSWRPISDLRFRATYSEAVRPPNISEAFGPQNQTFFSVDDPCSVSEVQLVDDPERRANRAANCDALGRPDGFESSVDGATIPGLQGGNPDLDEEVAETITIGAVYQPSWLDGLTLVADYWDITIEDAISTVSAQQILDRCVDSPNGPNEQFCSLIDRNDDFDITNILSIQQNLAALEASGIDFEARYATDLVDVAPFLQANSWAQGQLTLSGVATYLEERKEFPFQNEDVADFFEGELGDPEWAANLSVGYALNDLQVRWETRFIQSQILYDRSEISPTTPEQVFFDETGDVFYHDVQVRQRFGDRFEAYAGVDNLFDQEPPALLSGGGEGSAIYDAIGRRFYVGLNASF